MANIKKRQYAEAIYELAKEEKVVEDYISLSLAIINVANDNKQLFTYLGSGAVSIIEKKKLVKEISGEYEFYENWLNILIDSGRGLYIREYISEFINLYNKEKGIIKGYAYTTEPLEQKMIQKLQDTVAKKINKKVMLENKINKELIGGIRLEIEDEVWDNSIRNKLKQLLKEGSEI